MSDAVTDYYPGYADPRLGQLVYIGKPKRGLFFMPEGGKRYLTIIVLAYKCFDGEIRKARFTVGRYDRYAPGSVTNVSLRALKWSDATEWPKNPGVKP